MRWTKGTQLAMDGMLDLTLRPESRSVAEARMKVSAAIGPHLENGMDETLKLLVSEVVTNAVRHGGADGPVELHMSWNSEIRVAVQDRGEGFSPAARAGAPDDAGGFGLFLVGQLADRWGVEIDDGTTVWFVLRRH
jgi:anti-sigma regulatory factor (Ser/Thr protein kinase)